MARTWRNLVSATPSRSEFGEWEVEVPVFSPIYPAGHCGRVARPQSYPRMRIQFSKAAHLDTS